LGVTSEFTDAVTQQTHVNERRTIADRRQRKSETAFDERQASDRRDATVAGALNIIVLTSGKLRYGLIVDGLHDSEEIVVKPLGRHLTERCLAGATVLGDGCVAMILDVVGIANRSGMNVVEEEVAGGASSASSGGQEMMNVLLFRNDPEEQFGVPMSAVARIERIAADQIDTVAGREVLQYRGVTLELVSVENVINAKPRRLGKWAYVIVIRAFGQEMGLVAPRIMDIRSITAELDTHTFACKGVLGSLTVDDKVTRILEVFRMVEAIHPEWICDSSMPTKKVEEAGPWRILVAEDSSFFRKKLVKMLHEEGYEVTEFADGRLAWEELQINSQAYDIVVTDIEMPNMNGFELCERIRANDATRDLPTVAVTSLSSEKDQARGRTVGMTDYLVKLDRELLMKSLEGIKRRHRRPTVTA
jgi:two-component system chemotaxis sensor kinase CheA